MRLNGFLKMEGGALGEISYNWNGRIQQPVA